MSVAVATLEFAASPMADDRPRRAREPATRLDPSSVAPPLVRLA
ncbi:hypothetical protein [Saccharopolyspora erythraea]|nr:hypothetical protein [Saccharopolyspora erythraea]